MKQYFLLIAMFAMSYQTLAASLPAPQVVKITDRVYALIGPNDLPNKQNQGYMVNSTVIIGDQGVIVVDTGFTKAVGAHLLKAVAKITPKPVTHLINTHDHGDHYLGNGAFPNVEIWSSARSKELISQNGYESLALVEGMTQQKFPDTKPILATDVFNENTRTEKTIHGIKIVLWVPKGSHTPGDLLVFLPDDRVLIGGDVLVNGIVPNFRDASVKGWVETLQEAQSLDFVTAVPGHGALMTKQDVTRMHQNMAKLYAGVEAGYKKGLSDSETRKTLDLAAWKKLKRFDELIGVNINRAYLEVEAASF